MILPKEQIYRYMRHIIMPEISGAGQKKLLESGVQVFGETAEATAPLLYYIAASGIGHIVCSFQCSEGADKILENLRDLNPDVLVENKPSKLIGPSLDKNVGEPFFRVILGGPDFIVNWLEENSSVTVTGISSPTVMALQMPWQGWIWVFKERTSITMETCKNLSKKPGKDFFSAGDILSCCLLGALAAIEVIKLCLNLGKAPDIPMGFDLLSMEFTNTYDNGFPEYDTPTALRANSKSKLAQSKVLVVGTGGLGSPAAYALTLAGVGTIGLVDSDNVEISNLNRQILHSTTRIGTPKAKSAEYFLKKLNPGVNTITYDTRFTKANAMDIIRDFDVIVSAVDNLPTRFLLNDACFFAKKPLVEAGVLRFNGLGMTIIPGDGPCYRCVFPEMPPAGSVPSCSEAGILGPVPGVMGFIQAAETVKIITQRGKLLKNRLLIYDALDVEFRTAGFNKDESCPLCGRSPSITQLKEYEYNCSDQ